MSKSESQRKLTVRLPAEDVEWFEETYPAQGSKKWFFAEALRRFREMHDITPEEMISQGLEELEKTE